jgi:hypothetical protein
MLLNLLWDLSLVTLFGVQHSVFATLRAKKVVRRLADLDPLTWRGPQSFVNVLYVLTAACLWRPVDYVVWEFTGPAYWVAASVLYASWVWYFEIHIVEYDCGLAFGSTALINRLLGRNSPPLEMWNVGARRWSRFPVHAAFFPMFLAFPRMTADLLVLGVAGNFYNWAGTVLYDRRLKKLVGPPYLEYVRRTGLIFPPLFRHPAGAAGMTLPAPGHWKRPLDNVPGALVGVAGGLALWALLGRAEFTPAELWLSWGASFAVAVLGGALCATGSALRLFKASREDFDRFQTRVSTNTALISATSLVCWFAVSAARVGRPPTLGVVLPMWIVILWVGHVSAVTTLALAGKLAGPVTPPAAARSRAQ